MIDRRRDSFFVVALRALALGVVGLAFAWRVALPEGLAAAGIGAALGVFFGQRLGESRYRTVLVLATAALMVAAGVTGRALLVGSTGLVVAFGIERALVVADVVQYGLGLAGASAFLRAAAVRVRTLVVLEVAAAGAALASLVGAHRDGAINRPMELADWAWARGEDPAVLLVWLGAAATVVLVVLLLGERRARRAPLHIAAVVGLLALLLAGIRVFGLPAPPAAGDLGLTGKPQAGRPEGKANARGQRGGRSDQLTDLPFRDEYSSSGGDAPVAVILLHDDYSPPSAAYYFRQATFSQYNGHRLVAPTRSDVDRDLLPSFPTDPVTVAEPPPSDGRARVATTVALLVDHLKPFALESPLSAKPAQNPDPARFRRAYRVSSQSIAQPYEALLGHAAGEPSWSADVLRHYTETPPDPRYGALADEIVQGLVPQYAEDPLAKALAIKDWLDENGTYSRRSRHAEAQDPTADFLFGDRTGYCVHFAHAATYLYRSVGVPARVASGYAVGEQNRAGGSSIMVRGKEAHAWPEIHLSGVGWLVVDIQPHRSLEPPDGPPDRDLQRTLGEMARGQHRPEDKRHEEGRGRGRELVRAASRVLQALGRALGPVALGVLVLLYAIKLYRRFLAFRLVGPVARPRLAYRAALDRLSEVGATRFRGETREAFAARIEGLSPTLVRLTWAHLAVFFGSPGGVPERDHIGRMPGAVGREVRRRVPAWRWALGLVNPVSWLQSR
ncbi:MAG: transglutaminase domain-containing protein [Deltaproteobacteria bacterium]|nr:transglutaminase domain-containing protein [Deltaproteobacteria bacterium]